MSDGSAVVTLVALAAPAIVVLVAFLLGVVVGVIT